MTLWDVEQAEKKRQKRLDTIKNVVGRDTKLPMKLDGKQIGISRINNPEAILKKLGYAKRGSNGYVRYLDKDFRFHAFITVDRKQIYLHSDTMIDGKHRSSGKFVDDEKSLIRSEILRQNPLYVHEEGLSQEQIEDALLKLKEENKNAKKNDSGGTNN